jgi:hypothetical protein
MTKNPKTALSSQVIYGLLLSTLLVCLVVNVTSLRNNNQSMIRLRDELYAADKNDWDINVSLNKLHSYVTAHMNTDLSGGNNAIKPPIQLKYTYERLLAEQEARGQTANAQVYTDAQNYCQSQNSVDFSGRNRVPCVQEYVSSHGAAQAGPLPTGLYQFDFISPTWSPDLAGWSLVATVVVILMLIFKATQDYLLTKRLNY